MDRILVATDFSTRSDRALRRATLIARRVGASLVLAHVVDADRPQKLVAADRMAASAALDDIAQTLRDDGISSDPIVKVDDVHSGILVAADEAGAGLIVVGPHRSRLRDAFIGTIVERVLRQTTLPVLVAVDTPSASYARTLLALDFDEASKAAGRAALGYGIFERTQVVVMHAFDTPAKGMMGRSMETPRAIGDYVDGEGRVAAERVEALVSELGLPASEHRVVAMTGSPARSILEAAQNEDAHLIVMGTNQRKGFERLLIGSVAQEVIRDAHRDLLIVPTDTAGASG